MKIYLEYVFIDNVIINFLILLCVAKCLHYQYKKIFLILASIIGGVVSVVLPLFNIYKVWLFVIKIALGCLMILISFKFKTFKSFILGFITFISFTFLMGGACFALLIIFAKEYKSLNFSGYDASLPLGLMLAVISFYVAITINLAKKIYKRRDALQFIAKIKIYFNGKSLECKGFIDSGNRVFDNKTGLPVIIVSTSVLKNILSTQMLTKIYFPNIKNKDADKNFHFINFSTLSGDAKPMIVFVPDKVEFFYKKQKSECRVCVGITSKKFTDCVSYDAILHPSMLI